MAFPCSLFEYETHERHWPVYCLIAGSSMCFERHWQTFSWGLILLPLVLRNHFGKKKKKKKSACLFFYLFFPLLFFSLQAYNSYPAWKNLPDCIEHDATWIAHFLMRSRADSTVKRYLKEIEKLITWCKCHNISVIECLLRPCSCCSKTVPFVHTWWRPESPR